jgi:hypothetical protein
MWIVYVAVAVIGVVFGAISFTSIETERRDA